MKRKKETSVIDGFFDRFKDIASKNGRSLIRCSTDGQDITLGADYIFTNNTKFVLAEFKFEDSDLSSEKRKFRRLHLCKLLDDDSIRLTQSIRCHYIAWSHFHHNRTIKFNQYYYEICNKHIFDDSSNLKNFKPKYDARIGADSLIKKFLGNEIGVSYKIFEAYTNWLLEIDGKSDEGIELMLNNPDSDQLEFLEFSSVRDLKIWIDYNRPVNNPSPRAPGGGFGMG